MSGIFGISLPQGNAVDDRDLRRMAALLVARGPERTGMWREGEVALGHTLLATTPELVFERQPWRHAESGCVITADVRLDNRVALLTQLGMRDRAATIGDAELIVRAWLTWGEACTDRLLGDFAFALYDPRIRTLMLARDVTGMRSLYYHHQPGGSLVFASEARAVLASGLMSGRLNEGRIADFLVGQLEGYDKVSTFFEEVRRLAPAHRLVVTPESARLERYWRPEPQPELRLASDQAYADAFLEVFTEAVRCRLRSPDPVASMLSGGMDSGSVVAVARRLLADSGQPPLRTFSVVGPDPVACVETRTIRAAATMDDIDPHFIDYSRFDSLLPELESTGWNLQEPFDNHMTLLRAVWLAAHRHGAKVVLHGGGGDQVFAHGNFLVRLIGAGHWLRGTREAWREAWFYASPWPDFPFFASTLASGLAPPLVRRWRRAWRNFRQPSLYASLLKGSLISDDFARRIDLVSRLRTLANYANAGLETPYPIERAMSLDHPYAVVGHERYERVGSALAIESRDPFMDRRVVEFCLGLPGEQRLAGGWPKVLLRRAMAGRLPDAVRLRRGKQHLGWSSTCFLVRMMAEPPFRQLEAQSGRLAGYVDAAKLEQSQRPLEALDTACLTWQFDAAHLANWLAQQSSSAT